MTPERGVSVSRRMPIATVRVAAPAASVDRAAVVRLDAPASELALEANRGVGGGGHVGDVEQGQPRAAAVRFRFDDPVPAGGPGP